MPGPSVVVGAGTAGAVVAARLSEDPRRRVLLLEAGPDQNAAGTPAGVAGPNLFEALAEPGRSWPDLLVRRAAGDEPRPYPQGRGTGGSSAVNGMVAVPGLAGDYDAWDAAGAEGWSWRDLRPWFHRTALTLATWPEAEWAPFPMAFGEAALALGHRRAHGPASEGLVAAPLTMAGGRRSSINDSYVEAARARPNFEVRGQALVDRVLLAGRRAVGVRLACGEEIDAADVVVAAGALHSPAILLRSGVERVGIGANLVDHPGADVVVRLNEAARASSPAVPAVQCLLRWSSGRAQADLQLVPTALLGLGQAGLRSAQLMVGAMVVRSRGRVTLRSEDPLAEPAVDFDLLTDERDLALLRTGFRHLGEILRQREMRAVIDATAADDTAVSAVELADDALDEWLLAHPGSYTHAAGTCRMGDPADPSAVVDPHCQVIGYTGLRVADASVMPDLPRANPALTVVVIGERIAAMMRDDAAG